MSLTAELAAWSLALGAFLCAVYDLFRLPRIRKRQNAFVLFISDFLFCVIAAVSVIILFFNLTYGRMRAHSLVLILAGFALWRLTVSRITFFLLLRLINLLEAAVKSIITRTKAKLKLWSAKIYTKNYCGSTLPRIIKAYRKEFKNAKEVNPPQ